MKMFCGVFVFRAIAAADMATSKTKPKMHPRVTDRETLLATCHCVRLHFFHWELSDMLARCFHRYRS